MSWMIAFGATYASRSAKPAIVRLSTETADAASHPPATGRLPKQARHRAAIAPKSSTAQNVQLRADWIIAYPSVRQPLRTTAIAMWTPQALRERKRLRS